MNAEKAQQILAALEDGKSLRAACEGLCDAATVLKWKEKDEEFAQQYVRARNIGYQKRADEIIDIADTPMIGEIRTVKPDGSVEIKYVDMIDHRRLRVDSRKWELSKMLPKIYGDKVEHEHKGKVVIAATAHDESL